MCPGYGHHHQRGDVDTNFALEILVTKELFKDKTKLYMFLLVPKPPWKDVDTNFAIKYLEIGNRRILIW